MDLVGYFPATLAIDSTSGTRLRNAQALVYAMSDAGFTTPLAITDMSDVPFTGNVLTSNSDGIYPEFKPPAGVMQVIVKSGPALTPMTSIAVQAQAALDAAADAASAAGQALTAASSAAQAASAAAAVGATTDAQMAAIQADPTSRFAAAQAVRIGIAADAATVQALGSNTTIVQSVVDNVAAVTGGLGQTRTASVALTASAGAGGNVDTATAVHQRLPLLLAADTKRWRIRIRNYNDRDAVAYTGALSFSGVWFGEAELSTANEPTGNFVSTPSKVLNAFTTDAAGAEYVGPWVEPAQSQFGAYRPQLVSMAFTSAAQNHRGVGTVWRSSATGEAGDAVPATALTLGPNGPANGAPVLDIRIEVEVSGEVPIGVYGPGDSLTVGTGAKYPIWNSWATKHALANGIIPVILANHGSTLSMWAASTAAWKWARLDGTSAPDAVIISAGSNDVFNGRTLSQVQADFASVVAIARSKLSSNIYAASIMPRNGSSTDATREAVRVSYNDWLLTLPSGVRNVFDFSASVQAPVAANNVDSRFIIPDNVHLNDAGYARNANAVVARVAVRNFRVATVKYTPPALAALSFADYIERWDANQILQFANTSVSDFTGVGGRVLTRGSWSAPQLVVDGAGRRVVRFNGVTDGLALDLNRTQPQTIMLQGNVRALVSGALSVLIGASSSPGLRGALFVNSSAQLSGNAGVSLTLTSPTVPTATDVVLTVVFNGSSGSVWLNGTKISGNIGTEAAQKLFLGRWEAGNATQLDVRRLLIFPTALADATITSRVGELAALAN